MKRYARTAIESETTTLRGSPSGTRACATFRAAAALGNLVGSGELDRAETESLLLAAAIETGLPEPEARSHIRRGITCGEKTPRLVPDARPADQTSESAPRLSTIASVQTRAEPFGRPPRVEVDALWTVSCPVSADADACSWFSRRYGEHAATLLERVDLWSLARIIPNDVRLPRWAWSRSGSWSQTGHRLLFRLWDHHGDALSLRARCLDPNTSPKSLAPAGYSVKGLVLADPLGVQILSGTVPDWWTPWEVVVSEGEPDWLAWAARQSEAHEQGPAYFGVVAGGWSLEVACRIPARARVAVRTHSDPTGQKYAEQIAATLSGRCHLFRTPTDEAIA